ncbi:hypothetical protein [Mesonia sp. HuA40]|uniref:hypothetical protein n=1 Tax=Mesonia sp. HuA40 TaxID=2602761 RepID=UPI0011C7D1BE|nr:hypothetical protein [Mesonia sp. HuA40]TXK71595.1 hypothetical protein FT993_09345 [Mesonia sp. HuA40]
MIKKEIFIGFVVGIFANMAGLFMYLYFFSEYKVETSLAMAYENNVLGNVIALGAIANFLPFFVYIKKNKIYRARGVILATLLAGLSIIYFEFL